MSFVKTSLMIFAALLFSIGQACACAAEIPTDHTADMMSHSSSLEHTQMAGHDMALCDHGSRSCGSFDGALQVVLAPAGTDVFQTIPRVPQPSALIDIQAASEQALFAAGSLAGLRWLDPPGVMATPIMLKVRLLN